ncbi:MAG: tetratricopeptide repeat protein, partial [Desulfuromonadaceae bacterium]
MKSFSTPIHTHILPILLMTVAVALVYGRVLSHDFIISWDDGLYVVNNSAAQGITPDHLRQAFSRVFSGNYAPVQIISYMVDFELWGMRPVGYLLTNLLLHLGNGLLFSALIARYCRTRVAALAGAMIFLIHPVQVESVVWISQRKNLLAMTFFLAALLLYRRSRSAERPMPGYMASLAAFCLALLAKSVAVIFPLALMLYEFCYEPKDKRPGLLLRVLPFFAVAAGVAYLAVWSQSPEQGGGRVPWWGGSPFATFCNMLVVVMRYLGLLFRPLELSAVYEIPVKTGVDAAVIVAGAGVVALLALGCRLFLRHRRLFFWYALFFIGLLPVSQIVPLTTLMNDRYLYFPMLGCAALAAFGVDHLLSKAGTRVTAAVIAGLSALCLLSGYASYSRAAVWRDDITLWTDTTRKAPANADSWYNLGRSSQVRGRLDVALDAYLRALVLHPFHPKAFDNLSVIYPASVQFERDKLSIIKDLVRNYPAYPHGMFLLGHAGAEWRYLPFHRDLFLKLLRFNPVSPSALLGLGNVYLRAGNFTLAGQLFDRARTVGAARAEVEYDEACLLVAQGS